VNGYILHRAAGDDLVCAAHYIGREISTHWQDDLRLFG